MLFNHSKKQLVISTPLKGKRIALGVLIGLGITMTLLVRETSSRVPYLFAILVGFIGLGVAGLERKIRVNIHNGRLYKAWGLFGLCVYRIASINLTDIDRVVVAQRELP